MTAVPADTSAPPAIEFRGVTKQYGSGDRVTTALDTVTLQIPAGSIFGVLGESGAGKSTFLRLLNGLDQPTSGEVLVDGVAVSGLGKRELIQLRHRVGVVFQSFNLLYNRTVQQNVELPLRLQGRNDPDRVASMLDFVGLADRAAHYPAQLSGGQQQRVAIARAIVGRPSILLCDEPTSALDTRTTGEILDLLLRAQRELDTTIVLVSHELDVVKAICTQAAVFDRGALREILEVRRSTRDVSASYLEHARAVLTT